ncbi:MAG: PKD domain-containing protein, partial [Methanosarcinaceae archaeon]|nr:PKD domain-containing protein [Methanosarcinaceae archaeon]
SISDLDVYFTDASTATGTTITSWFWDFGDGTCSTEQNPLYTYACAGTYIVALTVSDGTLVDTVIQDVTVTGPVPPFVAPGTGSHGYWKNHLDAWVYPDGTPINYIEIGGVLYTKEDAIIEMKKPVKGDKTYTMFPSLVAAKLNVMVGNDGDCINDTIAEADEWMALNPLGSNVRGNSDAWEIGESLYWELDDYNNGELCAPSRDIVNE